MFSIIHQFKVFTNNVRIFKSEAKCFVMINFTSSFRAKKFMINDVLKYSSSTALQYLLISISDKSLSRFRSDFFKKQLRSDLHHKL